MRQRLRISPRAIAIALAAVAAVVLVGGQLFIPGIGERAIEDRLTDRGGSAEVEVRALPAVRLLFGDGDELRVRGRDLDFELKRQGGLEKLDGFGKVDVRLDSLTVGPIEVSSFELFRDGDEPYALNLAATFSPARLAGLSAARASGGGLLGALFGAAAGGAVGSALPEDARSIAIVADVGIQSDSGRIRVTSGQATVEGYPTGPLAGLITSVIVVRI